MAQADSRTTELFKSSGESPDELTHVSEIIKANGIPVAGSLKNEMFAELVRLTQEQSQEIVHEEERLRSA